MSLLQLLIGRLKLFGVGLELGLGPLAGLNIQDNAGCCHHVLRGKEGVATLYPTVASVLVSHLDLDLPRIGQCVQVFKI